MLPQFQVTTMFLGLFLNRLEVPDFKTFGESLPWRLPELDADVAYNNAPPNAPPDTPRVRFGSKDGRLMLEVAKSKIQFRMMPGAVEVTDKGANVQALPVDKAFEVLLPQASRIHSTLTEHFGASVVRVGVVADVIAPVASSANQRLQRTVFGGSNLLGDRLQDIQVNTMTRNQLDGGIQVNRRISLRSVRTPMPGNPDLIINVNVDVNTLAEEVYEIGLADLEKFLRATSDHVQTQIPLFHEKALFE